MTAAVQFPDGVRAASRRANPELVAFWENSPNLHIDFGQKLAEFRCEMTVISIDLPNPNPDGDPEEFYGAQAYAFCPEHDNMFVMAENPDDFRFVVFEMQAAPDPVTAAALIINAIDRHNNANLPVPLIVPAKNQDILN